MIYAKIDIEGRAMLQSAMKTAKSAQQYRRYKAVDLSSQGYEVPAIAKLLDASEAMICRLIHRVNEVGLDTLQPTYGHG